MPNEQIKGNTTRIYIGIDPGATGAIAFMFANQIEVYDFKDHMALERLRELRATGCPMHVVLEKVHSIFGASAKANFNFGSNVGEWRGILRYVGLPYDEIAPKTWQGGKKGDGIGGMFESYPTKPEGMKASAWSRKRKTMHRERAMQLYPIMRPQVSRAMDDGRADALLICGYCVKLHGQRGHTEVMQEDMSAFDLD